MVGISKPNECETVERGVTYLIKLAQHLCTFEAAAKICFVYRERNPGDLSMKRIDDLLKVKLTYPSFLTKGGQLNNEKRESIKYESQLSLTKVEQNKGTFTIPAPSI